MGDLGNVVIHDHVSKDMPKNESNQRLYDIP